VRQRFGSWARPMAGLLALALALAIAGPASAAEPASKVARPQTLTASAKASVAALPMPAAQAKAAPAPTTTSGSKGFFSTGAGKAAIVLMAAGTGFMVYSAFHDNNPVHSQFR
jgi:hypothetical protein